MELLNKEKFIELGLEVVNENAYEAALKDKDLFALMRKEGFGASDSSSLLGINLWTSTSDLVASKVRTYITDEERAVGDKENVRKGVDLEPIILKKFSDWSGIGIVKPNEMFRIKRYPYLTVNFDGVISLASHIIPVEAKFVSRQADRYWNKNKRIDNIGAGVPHMEAGNSVEHTITKTAEAYGIPNYYYTQIQQQILASEAPFGYLAVIFDKGWEFAVFKIYRDEFCIRQIIEIGELNWTKVLEQRKKQV